MISEPSCALFQNALKRCPVSQTEPKKGPFCRRKKDTQIFSKHRLCVRISELIRYTPFYGGKAQQGQVLARALVCSMVGVSWAKLDLASALARTWCPNSESVDCSLRTALAATWPLYAATNSECSSP